MTQTKSDDDAAKKQQQQRDSNDPKKERIQAEHDLVRDFISIFGKHHTRIVQQRRQAEDLVAQQQQQQQQKQEQNGSTMTREEFQAFATTTMTNAPKLTETEQRILSRTYYQNWNAGVIAGATTFGLLMGFSHLSARRLVAKRGILPPPPKKSYTNIDHQHHYKPSSSKIRNNNTQFQQMDVMKKAEQQQQSWAMDPSSVLSASPSWSSKNNNVSMLAAADESGIMSQIQMMVYGGMALVVTILTSWATIDQKQYYHELAKLPLAPGKSHLCHGACPEVIEKYQNIMTTTTASAVAVVAAATDPASILKDPMTEEAEAMTRLVINCQQRMQYEKDHQQDNNNNANNDEQNVVVQVVDVPEPGVQSNYSGISVRGIAATP